MKDWGHWGQSAFLFVWVLAEIGCTTHDRTIEHQKYYPVDSKAGVGSLAILRHVEDAIPEGEFIRNETFLGEDMSKFFINMFILPMHTYYRYQGDTSRKQIVDAVLSAHLSAAGLRSAALADHQSGQFPATAGEALSLSVRIQKLAVTHYYSTNSSVMILFFGNGITFYDNQVDIQLACELRAPGSPSALGGGLVSGKATREEFEEIKQVPGISYSGDAWILHEAISRAVQACASKTQVVQIATGRRNEAFSQAMKKAQETAAAGNPPAALSLYSQAYRVAGDSAQIFAVIRTVSEVVSKLPNKPELPEEARRFAVQANVAAEQKKYDEAIALFSQSLEVAPWWAESHFNRALILANQNRYPEAVTSMKQFLILAPNAPDARAAQDKIYEWELKAK